MDRYSRLSDGVFTAALLVSGCLNGLAFDALSQDKADSATMGFSILGASPLLLTVIAICAMTMSSSAEGRFFRWPSLLFCVAILIPSSLVSWAATLVFSGYVAARTKDQARAAALLFAGVAATALWSILGEPRAAGVFLPLDAALTSHLLSLFRDGASANGNLVGAAGGHRIVVLATCSPFHVLPIALLGWCALELYAGQAMGARLLRKGILLTLAILVASYIRLTAMAWSPELYSIVHGPQGAAAFDLLVVILIIIAALAGRQGFRDATA